MELNSPDNKNSYVLRDSFCAVNGIESTDWKKSSPRDSLMPYFGIVERNGEQVYALRGNGRSDCVGHISKTVSLGAGRTYELAIIFWKSACVNPNSNFIASIYADGYNNGIFNYSAGGEGIVYGSIRFTVPSTFKGTAEIRLYFRGSADGEIRIKELSLREVPGDGIRPVKVACTAGAVSFEEWSRVLDVAGNKGVDLVLLPEGIRGNTWEDFESDSAAMMGTAAEKYSMYVAGGIYFYDKRSDRLFNRVLLYNRAGERAGFYDKIHPYTPEILDLGVTAGADVPVFQTDFGMVGCMTCYDSWFPDIAELLGLKGAEIVLFPSAGYYRSLMPARSADNCLRIVASSLNTSCGIWDTAGRDVKDFNADSSCFANEDRTVLAVEEILDEKTTTLISVLDLSKSPSPHNWGGPMLSAPGGRRNRREQLRFLYSEIEEQVQNFGPSR